MRICHVSVSLMTGGLERVLSDLATQSNRQEFDMSFVALREEGRFAEEIRRTNAQVLCLGSQSRWMMVKRLKSFLHSQSIDIVHTHNTYPHLYGTLAAKLARVPIVINTRHGQRIGHGWKSRFLFRLACHWVDRVVAVSDDAAALCIQSDKIPKAKVIRIWNGIDSRAFAYAGPCRKPIAVTVARLVPEKDIATLIRATAIAARSEPDLQLRIIGDGPLRVSLESLAAELGIADRVEFLGECKEIPPLLSACGFFVSSSLSEGISLTILEAMAVGLPVIATQVGGNPEIIVDNETGILVPASDSTKMADAMLDMCRQSARWKEMGQAGRSRITQFFDATTMANNYQALYRDLINKAGK